MSAFQKYQEGDCRSCYLCSWMMFNWCIYWSALKNWDKMCIYYLSPCVASAFMLIWHHSNLTVLQKCCSVRPLRIAHVTFHKCGWPFFRHETDLFKFSICIMRRMSERVIKLEDIYWFYLSNQNYCKCTSIIKHDILMYKTWQWESRRFRWREVEAEMRCRKKAAAAVVMVTDGTETEKRNEKAMKNIGNRIKEWEMESAEHGVTISLSSKCSPEFTMRRCC